MSAVELIKDAPTAVNRSNWALRGDPNYAGAEVLLSVEVAPDGWEEAAYTLDNYAKAYGRPIVEIQKVQRKDRRALYGRLGQKDG